MPTASVSVLTPIDGHRLDHGRFAGAGGGHHQFRDAALGRRHRHRQGALDRSHAAVQGQLADRGEVLQLIGQQLTRCHQQRQRDRQIEAAGVFLEIGRSEVDDRAAGVTCVAEIGQGALDAMNALLDRHLRQTDENGLRQTCRNVDFRLDGNGVDAHQGEGVELGEHERAAPVVNRGSWIDKSRFYAIHDSRSTILRLISSSRPRAAWDAGSDV